MGSASFSGQNIRLEVLSNKLLLNSDRSQSNRPVFLLAAIDVQEARRAETLLTGGASCRVQVLEA